MEIKVDYTPNAKQRLFHLAEESEVVYGGAKGGGKSKALVMEAMAYGMINKGANLHLFRETYDDLEANLVREWKASVPKELYQYNESKHIARLINGSEVYFRYIANDDDAESYQGRSIDFIGIDELTKHSEKAVQVLLSCLRSVKGFKPLFRGTCNPGGKGHQWVKDRYITPTHKGEKSYIDEKTGNSIAFIPALVYDNVALMENDPAYVKRLENLPDAEKKAFLYGDWDIFEGQYFSEFNYDIHTCKPFEIPEHWQVFTTMDYGLDMLAHYRAAIDEYGTIYITHEIYQSGLIVSQAVEKIKAQEANQPIARYAPPDLWNTQSAIGKSTALLFNEFGLALTRANNDRVAGWLAIRELLQEREIKLEDGNIKKQPKLVIFRNCANLIRCIPMAQYSDKNPNDIANDPHEITHSLDAIRYLAISYTNPAQPLPKPKGKMDWFFNVDDNDSEEKEFW